jgi:hypothetical protein
MNTQPIFWHRQRGGVSPRPITDSTDVRASSGTGASPSGGDRCDFQRPSGSRSQPSSPAGYSLRSTAPSAARSSPTSPVLTHPRSADWRCSSTPQARRLPCHCCEARRAHRDADRHHRPALVSPPHSSRRPPAPKRCSSPVQPSPGWVRRRLSNTRPGRPRPCRTTHDRAGVLSIIYLGSASPWALPACSSPTAAGFSSQHKPRARSNDHAARRPRDARANRPTPHSTTAPRTDQPPPQSPAAGCVP